MHKKDMNVRYINPQLYMNFKKEVARRGMTVKGAVLIWMKKFIEEGKKEGE